jgi:hypothetical protein
MGNTPPFAADAAACCLLLEAPDSARPMSLMSRMGNSLLTLVSFAHRRTLHYAKQPHSDKEHSNSFACRLALWLLFSFSAMSKPVVLLEVHD